jgi:hypothetical protein
MELWEAERNKIKDPDPTLYSCFIFLTNALTAFRYGDYTYSSLFVLLFITSIVYRISHKHFYTFILDRFLIICVIGYGGYVFYSKNISRIFSSLIIGSFLTIMYLFYYGYKMSIYCYDPNENVSNGYHSLLHLISSIGHHLIIMA